MRIDHLNLSIIHITTRVERKSHIYGCVNVEWFRRCMLVGNCRRWSWVPIGGLRRRDDREEANSRTTGTTHANKRTIRPPLEIVARFSTADSAVKLWRNFWTCSLKFSATAFANRGDLPGYARL